VPAKAAGRSITRMVSYRISADGLKIPDELDNLVQEQTFVIEIVTFGRPQIVLI
jgi:hypothetical protein